MQVAPQGAGAWGVINKTCRSFAVQLRFHIDACQPRHPQGKGKVERHVRDLRETVDPRREVFDSLEQLQAVTDARLAERAARLRCPATGASLAECLGPGTALGVSGIPCAAGG